MIEQQVTQVATLSAVIITKNEELNIGRCIESLLPVIDEVIVIDSFSTDMTLEIASSKGAQCIQVEWKGYAATKNFGNTLATMDFIFSIDADEALSPRLQESIAKFKAAPYADLGVVNRLTNYCGKWIRHSGWYPEYKTRLFRKSDGSWRGDVHEELDVTGDLKSAKLEGDLLHYSYPTIESHLAKIPLYATLAAQRDLAKGKPYHFMSHGLMKPAFMFFKKYFLKLGLLDGFYGFVIALLSSLERFIRYAKYVELKKAQKG